jgi:hypothetical protein
MNQISPRAFEAIACRTALVLFEGLYSGVLEPGKHFIALKKDFSNVDDVLAKLQDDAYLEAMTERAYADIIGSGRFSYEGLVRLVDETLGASWPARMRAQPAWLPLPACDALPEFRAAYIKNFQPNALRRAWQWIPRFIKAGIDRGRVQRVWTWFPGPLRSLCRALFKPAH